MDLKSSFDKGIPDSWLTIAIITAAVCSSTFFKMIVPVDFSSAEDEERACAEDSVRLEEFETAEGCVFLVNSPSK